jgi:hypothetical protein
MTEIFAVSKGNPRNHCFPASVGPENEIVDTPYHQHTSEILTALEKIVKKMRRDDVQVVSLLRRMFEREQANRPTADAVWKRLTTCTAHPGEDTIYYCGPCCMPLIRSDPLLNLQLDVELSDSLYTAPCHSNHADLYQKDPEFRFEHPVDAILPLEWKRNVRHDANSLLDTIRCASQDYLVARKQTVTVAEANKTNDKVLAALRHEARILCKLEKHKRHRHIVKFVGTYSQASTYTLLLEPSAEYDMRTYLQLFEIVQGGGDSAFHEHTTSDSTRKHIAQSFGCLANAVEFLHALGLTHNDIRPENILMDKGRWYLSKFEHAAIYQRGERGPIIESFEAGQPPILVRSYAFQMAKVFFFFFR